MKAVIGKKILVAKGTLYVEFDLLGEQVSFEPGQYFFVTLNPSDQALKEQLTHHFSIVNSPGRAGVLALTTRIRPQSLFKRTLEAATEGAEVEIGKIAGSFTLPDNSDEPIVFIALGIGITPYISMLRWSMEENKDYKFSLIYSDDDSESMAFLDELKQFDKDHDNFKLIVTVTNDENWKGESRYIDGQFLKDYFNDTVGDLYYISGPPKAVEAVAGNLKKAGISEDSLKTDSFTGY